jgi:hypothetical protein
MRAPYSFYSFLGVEIIKITDILEGLPVFIFSFEVQGKQQIFSESFVIFTISMQETRMNLKMKYFTSEERELSHLQI